MRGQRWGYAGRPRAMIRNSHGFSWNAVSIRSPSLRIVSSRSKTMWRQPNGYVVKAAQSRRRAHDGHRHTDAEPDDRHRVRGRAGAAIPWSPHDTCPPTSAAGASRTAFALHVGQPVKRASGFVARRTRGGGHRPLHGSAGTGRSAGSASVRVLAADWLLGFWLGRTARRTPHRARDRVDAINHNPSYRRAKSRAERQRASHCWAAYHHDE